jgi:hypothetical protein
MPAVPNHNIKRSNAEVNRQLEKQHQGKNTRQKKTFYIHIFPFGLQPFAAPPSP